MFSLYLAPSETDLSRFLENKTPLEILGDEAKHINVARHKIGEKLWISNGAGERGVATIQSIDKERVTLIFESVETLSPRAICLRVIQALTKSDRAQECIELLVEAGVDEIIPWQAERSIGKWQEPGTRQKWQSWVRAAVKQSRRADIPTISGTGTGAGAGNSLPRLIDQLRSEGSEKDLFFIFDENATNHIGKDFVADLSAHSLTIIIGPEGGITEQELMSAIEAGAISVKLGQPILRSAHAGAIALAAIQSAFGIWE
jgi:16S rRNA (uracil1498-N3)-methyltransferase